MKKLMAMFLMLVVLCATAFAEPGTLPEADGKDPIVSLLAVEGGITPFTTEHGKISLSIDGLGSNSASDIIQVEKPAGATVRTAYLAAASTGGSGRVLADGDVKIDGNDVVWNVVPSFPSSISSSNSLADVTSLVKAKIDAAPAGRVDFTLTEVSTFGIDGEVLAVIFDDPNQVKDNTVVLLFGAQKTTGDSFQINLADPIDTGRTGADAGACAALPR